MRTGTSADRFFNPASRQLYFNTNGQNSGSRASRLQLVGRVTKGLTAQGGRRNRAGRPIRRALIANNPGSPIRPAHHGICNAVGQADFTPIPNPFGADGSPSANSPPMQFSAARPLRMERRDYRLRAVRRHAHDHRTPRPAPIRARPGSHHDGPCCASRIPPIRPTMQRSGVAKDAVVVQRSTARTCRTRTRACSLSTDQFIVAQTPLRPRVMAWPSATSSEDEPGRLGPAQPARVQEPGWRA